MSELISIFSSCVSNETTSVGDEVQNLTNALNNLRGHIKTGIETGIMCIQHPLTIPTCIYNVSICQLIFICFDTKKFFL